MPTIRHVATAAGVSVATVSRVLSGHAEVSAALAKRVRSCAQELGYQPNSAARGLRTGRSLSIGLVAPDIQNPFFTSVIAGIEQELQAAGYSLLLTNADEQPEREQLHVQKLRADGVAGVLLTPSAGPDFSYADLTRSGLPVVTISRTHPSLPVDSVTVNNCGGVCRAVSHLLGLGHRRIAFINGPAFHSTARERLTGYQHALEAAGVPIDRSLIRAADFRESGGAAAMRSLLAEPLPPTAVVVGNNLMTLGALNAIHSAGLAIPRDIALVGFDDMPWATSLQPPLTAVAQPTLEIGKLAAQLLLGRIADPDRPVRHVVLETTLRVRASCGARK